MRLEIRTLTAYPYDNSREWDLDDAISTLRHSNMNYILSKLSWKVSSATFIQSNP